MLWESHKLLDTCNLVPPAPAPPLLVELSLIFVVGLCSWPNGPFALLLLLLLLTVPLVALFPCNFAPDGMSQSFWFPGMPLNRKSRDIIAYLYFVLSLHNRQKKVTYIFNWFFVFHVQWEFGFSEIERKSQWQGTTMKSQYHRRHTERVESRYREGKRRKERKTKLVNLWKQRNLPVQQWAHLIQFGEFLNYIVCSADAAVHRWVFGSDLEVG